VKPRCEPFDGTPPDVHDGDTVEVRDAAGNWHRARCGSEPRYDVGAAGGRTCWLTVRVDPGEGWVNWPAGDVRPAREDA
jgi:hypothetical protein